MASIVTIEKDKDLAPKPLSITDDTYSLVQSYEKLTKAINRLSDTLEVHH